MKRSIGLLLATLVCLASCPIAGQACSRMYSFRFGELFTADLIVRATALKYVTTPKPDTRTTGVPESTVEFRIEETIWGVDVPATIVLHGYLADRDDFNEVPLPYRFVRPGGRAGSCFANSYKTGAQFLLFLKRGTNSYVSTSGYTTNISALGPTNEQLRGPDDPWLQWVKAYVSPCAAQDERSVDYADSSKAMLDGYLFKEKAGLQRYRIAKCYLVKFGAGHTDATKYREVVDKYEGPERRE